MTRTMTGRKETGKKGTTEKAAGGKVSNQGDAKRRSYSEAVIEGALRTERVFMGDSILRKIDRTLSKGVPQGSVLGPILFLIYINDLDDDITSKVLKFADDTKVFRKIKSDADRQHLQDYLYKLIEWSEKWQMLFNFGKCKCLHTGHGNEDAQYTMGGTVLNTTLKEKDLGLTTSADMKVSEQCGIAAAK